MGIEQFLKKSGVTNVSLSHGNDEKRILQLRSVRAICHFSHYIEHESNEFVYIRSIRIICVLCESAIDNFLFVTDHFCYTNLLWE